MSTCVGCGLEVVDGILVAEISATAGNALSCTADGLYVPGAVGISPNACNAITNPGNGLYAPCMRGLAGGAQMASPQNASLPVNPAAAGTYGFESDVITLTNSGCREVQGVISIQTGGLYSDADAGGWFATGHLDVDIDGAGWTASTPDTSKRVDSPGLHYGDFNNIHESNYLAIAAGDSVTYKARLVVVVASGTANLHGAVSFGFEWVLTAVGAC